MTVGWFSWTNRNCLLLVATKKIALFSIDNILRLIMAISCLPKWANAAFRVIVKDFEIKELFFFCNLFLHYTKQIDSMLPCVWSVIGHSRRKNVVRTSMKHSTIVRVPLFCSYHILTSSVIYYWTDGRQHGIYLLNINTSESLGEREMLWEHELQASVYTAFLSATNFARKKRFFLAKQRKCFQLL